MLRAHSEFLLFFSSTSTDEDSFEISPRKTGADLFLLISTFEMNFFQNSKIDW